MATVTLHAVDPTDARLSRLLQLYIHEWSGLIPVAIGADALFVYSDLARSEGFLFIEGDGGDGGEGGKPVGFALALREGTVWSVEDFFVIAGARRRGVGATAVAALLAARPGRWTLTVRPENPGALAFWRRALPGADEKVEVGGDGISRTRLSSGPILPG